MKNSFRSRRRWRQAACARMGHGQCSAGPLHPWMAEDRLCWQERPSASISLMACGIVSGIFPAVLHGFEAQTGPVHVQVLRATPFRRVISAG